MTSKHVTFCRKHKDAPLRTSLRKVVGTQLWAVWGGDSFQWEAPLGPDSMLELKVTFHSKIPWPTTDQDCDTRAWTSGPQASVGLLGWTVCSRAPV